MVVICIHICLQLSTINTYDTNSQWEWTGIKWFLGIMLESGCIEASSRSQATIPMKTAAGLLDSGGGFVICNSH